MTTTQNELPEYVKISVAAVGGMDTPEGQEMLRLLMESGYTVETRALPAAAPSPEPAVLVSDAPDTQEDANLMPAVLTDLFDQVFNGKHGVS